MFTATDESVAWLQIKRAREALASYLATLSPSQWQQASLSRDWLVSDVVAHLLLEYHYTVGNSWKDFIRSGLNVNKFMKRTAITLGNTDTAELLHRFRTMISEQYKPSSVSTMNVLADLLVHEQDIRVPLQQPRSMPLESLRLIFSHWQPTHFNFGEKLTGVTARIRGLEFDVVDLRMHKGFGLLITGTAEDILLAVTGRTISVDRLEGPGLETLRRRLATR